MLAGRYRYLVLMKCAFALLTRYASMSSPLAVSGWSLRLSCRFMLTISSTCWVKVIHSD